MPESLRTGRSLASRPHKVRPQKVFRNIGAEVTVYPSTPLRAEVDICDLSFEGNTISTLKNYSMVSPEPRTVYCLHVLTLLYPRR